MSTAKTGHHRRGEIREYVSHERRPTETERDAGDATKHGEQEGFDEELAEDVLTTCADSTTNTDLVGALADGREHEAHDADPAGERAR